MVQSIPLDLSLTSEPIVIVNLLLRSVVVDDPYNGVRCVFY